MLYLPFEKLTLYKHKLIKLYTPSVLHRQTQEQSGLTLQWCASQEIPEIYFSCFSTCLGAASVQVLNARTKKDHEECGIDSATRLTA